MTRPRPSRPLLLSVAVALLSPSVPVAAQEPAAEPDWRMPFRSFEQPIDPPKEAFRELRQMLLIRRTAPEDRVSFDDTGREVVDDPEWKAAKQRLLSQRYDAGYLSLILRESSVVEDRELAMYGMFYVADAQTVFQLIEHVPGEPVRALREMGFPRAIEFMAVQLPKRVEGDLAEWKKLEVGPAGERPPRPGSFRYGFDPAPFFALLDVDDPRDHAQALWFLGEVVRNRPETAEAMLEGASHRIAEFVVSDAEYVRPYARTLLELCDPSKDDVPAEDADDEALVRWCERVLYEVFPPIRAVSAGLVELHDSEDLDALVEVGRKRLQERGLGSPSSGRIVEGPGRSSFYRGFRLAPLPEPLDKLGLPEGAVITSINGIPVATAQEVLAAVRQAFSGTRNVAFVEMVVGDRRAVRRFVHVRGGSGG